MSRPGISHVVRLLRADVPPLEDEQFVVVLAEVARSATTAPIRNRVPLGVKLGAIAASVALTMFGAAYASDLLTPAPPTDLNPTSPVTDAPTEHEREIHGPRKSDKPVDVDPSPATPTKSSAPEEVPAHQGVTPPDATVPTGGEDEHSTEQPPPPSDPEPGEDDSDSGADSDEPDDHSGPDRDGSGDDSLSDHSDSHGTDDDESDDDSEVESQNEPDDSSDVDSSRS